MAIDFKSMQAFFLFGVNHIEDEKDWNIFLELLKQWMW